MHERRTTPDTTSFSATVLTELDRQTIRQRLAVPLLGDCGDHDLNPGFKSTRKQLLPAAVLVPLVERPDGLTVLLTRRTVHLRTHAGQISFPGGKMEPDDSDAVSTALRETEEEVGVPKIHIDVVGRLDRYVTRTGYDITPVVGFVKPPFPIRPDPYEVEEVFEAPLSYLLDPANRVKDSRQFQGQTRYFYAMPFGEYYIWGATAGMLVNLAKRLMPNYRQNQ